jgi:hypothetical protein
MAYFNNTDRAQFIGLNSSGLVSQSPPDATDDGSWVGDPADQAMSTQIWALKNSTAYLARMMLQWSYRENVTANPNYSANLLGANFGTDKNQLLRRTTCIPFQGGFAYITGQRVYDSVTALNYASLNNHTSAATFAADIANWSVITVAVDKTPECRVEYSTYAKAIAATRATISFLSGNAATGTDGYEDICTAAGLTFYSAAAAEASPNTIFTYYPLRLQPTQVGLPSGVGFAVAHDTVIFLPAKLTDIWSAWTNSGSNTVGQIKQDAQLLSFWWCAVANTSSASGTFAQDRAGAAAGKWLPIEVGVTLDHECSDRRPPTIAEDPTAGKDGNVQYQMESIGPMLRTKGYQLDFYTNDMDVLSGVSRNNGITETSIPYILANVDQVQSITDGNNYRGNDFFADFLANYNRWRYVNANPVQGQRAAWSVAKSAMSLEMVERYANQAWAITAVTVGAAPTYTVVVRAPNNNFTTGQYANIWGLEYMGIPAGAYRVTNPNVGTSGNITIATRVTNVAPWTGTVTTAAFSGQSLTTYLGGGAAMAGGSTFKDIIKIRRFARSFNMPNINQWRNFGEQNGDLLNGPSRIIAGVTNTNPAVVTTTTPHDLTTSAFDVRVTHNAVNGMTMLNGLSLPITVISPTSYSLDNYDARSLPAYTGGGVMQPTRRAMFNRKTNIFAFNRGTPKLFI